MVVVAILIALRTFVVAIPVDPAATAPAKRVPGYGFSKTSIAARPLLGFEQDRRVGLARNDNGAGPNDLSGKTGVPCGCMRH